MPEVAVAALATVIGREIVAGKNWRNLIVLAMLGVYAGLHALALPLVPLMMGFGGLIAVFMVALMLRRGARPRAQASGAGQR